jgi:hypothetical protein
MQPEHQPIGDSFAVRRSIGDGFLAIRTALGPMWIAGLLMSISDCGGGGGDFGDLGELIDRGDENASALFAQGAAGGELVELAGWVIGLVIAFVLVALLVGLLLFALNSWLTTGFYRLHVNILEHASDDLGPLFSGKDRFWAMAGYKALAGLLLWATAVAAIWPGALLAYYGYARDRNTLMIGGFGAMVILAVPALVYVALGVYLGEHVVALDRATPVEALRRAWALARGNRMPLLGFGIVCMLVQFVSVAGIVLCCVGVLATVPFGRSLVGFAKTEGYLLFTRGSAQTASWRLWHKAAEEDRPPEVLAEP